MKNLILIFLTFIIFAVFNQIIAQNVFGPDTANYKRYIQKSGDYPPNVSNYLYKNYYMSIGRSGSFKYRALYQWDLSSIPDNSQIDTIEIFFLYTPVGSKYYISVIYFNVGVDLTNPDSQTIWDRTNSNEYIIGDGQGNKYGSEGTRDDTVNSIFGPNSTFCNAVENELLNDKFILGIISISENYDYLWFILNNDFSLVMRIVYSPPQQLVEIDQKLNTNDRIDSVGLWNPAQDNFDKYSVPQDFNWDVGSSKTLLGSQKIISNQKYIHWENNYQIDNLVVNHKTFQIYTYTNNLTSRFEPTQSGITLKNNLELTNTTGGNIDFKDPWLIDYPDPQYGNQKRNRGMDAPFKQRSSPFNPDYTTSYNGDVYKGVFLNQGLVQGQWIPPYYSVRAQQTQDIPLPNIGTRKFYFLNWGGSNVQFQNANALETGVVFRDANAVAEANYKGQGLSNQTDAYNSNSQRKIKILALADGENKNYFYFTS